MPVAGATNTLVGRVLDGLDEGVRARCNRAGVLFALDGLGCAASVADLREMLAIDAAGVKAAIGDAAPGFFFVRLKQAVESGGGSADFAANTAASHGTVYPDTSTAANAASMAVDLPLVVTIKFNGKVVAERSTLLASPTATWEAVARQRLDDMLGAKQATS